MVAWLVYIRKRKYPWLWRFGTEKSWVKNWTVQDIDFKSTIHNFSLFNIGEVEALQDWVRKSLVRL